MKRQNAVQIGELIRKAIEEAGSTDTFNAQRLCHLWPEAVGPTINRFTTARWVTRNELHVRVASAPMKNELSFMANAIMERLNQLAGTSDNPKITKLVIH